MQSVTATTERSLLLIQGRVTTLDGEEHPLGSLSVSFEQTTGMNGLSPSSTLHIVGGKGITITALEKQDVVISTVDGRVYFTAHVHKGENYFEVPSGVYIVAEKKVIVL